MPKRKTEEKIERYRNKIRKLEEKSRRPIRRSESSDAEEITNWQEAELPVDTLDPDAGGPMDDLDEVTVVPETSLEQPPTGNETAIEVQASPTIPDLDPTILAALGEITNETPEFGENIHNNLAKMWLPLLKKGMTKENRESIIKNYLVPENCPLLQAPTLNPEILAAIPESGRFRDKKMATCQQQLGVGITAINRGLHLLISDDNKVEAIKHISDGCRILSDLHHQNTESRIRFITPCLDKSFLQFIERSERDNTLFGNDLAEKIKASKAIVKQSELIKKTLPTPKASTSSSNSRPQQLPAIRSSVQGNWPGPSRFQTNRGGRGGYKRPSLRAPPASSQPRMNYRTRASTRRH